MPRTTSATKRATCTPQSGRVTPRRWPRREQSTHEPVGLGAAKGYFADLMASTLRNPSPMPHAVVVTEWERVSNYWVDSEKEGSHRPEAQKALSWCIKKIRKCLGGEEGFPRCAYLPINHSNLQAKSLPKTTWIVARSIIAIAKKVLGAQAIPHENPQRSGDCESNF